MGKAVPRRDCTAPGDDRRSTPRASPH
jgi:hypothetical protein